MRLVSFGAAGVGVSVMAPLGCVELPSGTDEYTPYAPRGSSRDGSAAGLVGAQIGAEQPQLGGERTDVVERGAHGSRSRVARDVEVEPILPRGSGQRARF